MLSCSATDFSRRYPICPRSTGPPQKGVFGHLPTRYQPLLCCVTTGTVSIGRCQPHDPSNRWFSNREESHPRSSYRKGIPLETSQLANQESEAMTSVLASHPGDIQLAMSPTQEPTPPENNRMDDDGRARSLSQGDLKAEAHDNDIDDDHADDGGDSSDGEDGPARKRRRSRKGLDKKFECPHDGCGKSYSRAEHL